MNPQRSLLLPLMLGLGTLLITVPEAPAELESSRPRPQNDMPSGGRAASLDRLPLPFEQNRGQVHKDVRFLARGRGYHLFLTAGEAVLASHGTAGKTRQGRDGSVLRMRLLNCRNASIPEGLDALPGKVNYLVGDDPTEWRRNVPTFGRVRYPSVYPGIDLVYYGKEGQLEYDFVLQPGANPRVIRLAFGGARKAWVDRKGDLVLRTSRGEVRWQRPFTYQEVDGRRRPVPSRYVLRGRQGGNDPGWETQISFRVGEYDRTRPLVIDPALVFATYLGGSHIDDAGEVAVDSTGSAYVTGVTYSPDYPVTTGPGQPQQPCAFVTRYAPDGSALLYSTFIGGTGGAHGQRIAVDPAGNAYVAGFAGVPAFPTTPGAFDPTGSAGPGLYTFLTKLGPTGTVLYSTLVGPGWEEHRDVTIDAAGHVYLAGPAPNAAAPAATPGAYQWAGGGNLFVSKFDFSQQGPAALLWTAALGSYRGVVEVKVAGDGRVYVGTTTPDGNFPVTPNAFRQVSSGGTTRAKDYPWSLPENPADPEDPYFTIYGYDFNDPSTWGYVHGGPWEGVISRLSADGTTLEYASFFGGTGIDSINSLALGPGGTVLVFGSTYSPDLPTTSGTFQQTIPAVLNDGYNTFYLDNGFVAKFDTTLAGEASLIYATYLSGTNGWGEVGGTTNSAGEAYAIGITFATDFPTLNPVRPFVGAPAITLTKLSADGQSLILSTYLAGGSYIEPHGIALYEERNGQGQIINTHTYLTARIDANTLDPRNALQPTLGGGQDGALIKVSEANTPIGVNIQTSPTPTTSLTFQSVIATGETTVATSTGSPPQSGGTEVPAPGVDFAIDSTTTFYDIETTAQFDGPVELCLPYDPAVTPNPVILHWDDTLAPPRWVSLTTTTEIDAAGRPMACAFTTSFSPFVVTRKLPRIDVGIDIRPGTFPNSVNLGSSGVVQVAILSAAGFNAETVDPTTVTLANAAVKLKGNGTPQATLADVNGDGLPDLVVHVSTSALQLTTLDTIATLTGKTRDGQTYVVGTDTVRVVR